MTIVKMIYFSSVPIAIVYSFSEIKKSNKNLQYARLVRALLVMTFISIFSAYLFWGQSLLLSYRVTAYSMAIVYFFVLLKVNPDIKFLEKVIWFLCIIYLIIWIYSVLKAPTMVFGVDHESGLDNSRGIYRLHIPGKGIIILAFFLALNKFSINKKFIWIIIASLLFFVIIMHVIRQVIFFSFLVGLFYVLKEKRFVWLWIILIGIFSLIGNHYIIESNGVLSRLFELSEGQYFNQMNNEDNIRIVEYEYYFTEYSKNIFTDIFGNGIPHSESSFGKNEEWLNRTKHIYSSDVGYASIYIKFGVIGLILYLIIFYLVLRQKVVSRFYYTKLFMIYMIFANIAASWVFHDVTIICICLFILEKINREKNYSKFSYS